MFRIVSLSGIFALVLASSSPVFACSIDSQPPVLKTEEAVKTAAAVFVGEVTSIEDKWPDDFIADDKVWSDSEKQLLERHGKIGYQVHIKVDRAWKGIDKREITLLMPYPYGTCDNMPSPGKVEEYWSSIKGKRLFFVSKFGNYLTLPTSDLDPLTRWGQKQMLDENFVSLPNDSKGPISALGKPANDFRGNK